MSDVTDRKSYMRDWHKKRMDRIASDPEYADKIRKQSRDRSARYYQKKKDDPVAYAEYLNMKKHQAREKVRKRLGLPEDAPVLRAPANTVVSIEDRRKRNADNKRRAYRLAHGIPLDAPVGCRKPKGPSKPKLIDQERAKRAAEVEAAKALALVKESLTTETPVCPDPPELQELFRRASKGEPPRPFPAAGRKRSVFQLRSVY